MDDRRAFAAVIVAHDSAGALPRTLSALVPQLDPADEVVIVDCGSSDDLPGALAGFPDPRVRLHRLEENLGFAGGAVAGARLSSAPLLLFLNPDAVPQPGCLEALRDAAGRHPGWGAWQALVTLPGGRRVNTRGGVVHYLGFGWAGGCGEPVPTATRSEAEEVAFASGAALAVRREAWDAAGGFDPTYFMYGEDLDLSLRLWLSGRVVAIVPQARVEHDYDFHKGAYKWFYLERNRARTVLVDYPAPLLALLAPGLLGFELVLLAVAAREGWLRPKLRAQAAVLRELAGILRRRRQVQRLRSESATAFAARLTASLDSPYINPPSPLLARAQAAHWTVVRALVALLARG